MCSLQRATTEEGPAKVLQMRKTDQHRRSESRPTGQEQPSVFSEGDGEIGGMAEQTTPVMPPRREYSINGDRLLRYSLLWCIVGFISGYVFHTVAALWP